MKKYAEKDGYVCYLLEEADWEASKAISLAVCSDSGDEDVYEEDEISNDEFWKYGLKIEGQKFFCLMWDDTLIGTGSVDVEQSPSHISNVYILKAHRGNKFVQIIQEGCLRYLADEGYGAAIMEVSEENESAKKMAERSGFRYVHLKDGFHRYERSLDDFSPDLDEPTPPGM